MRTHWGETLMGFVVLVLAGLFLAYALSVAGVASGHSTYMLTARFGDAGGLMPGAKVTVSGVKVGTVDGVTLDAKNYLAVVRLSLSDNVKIATDSTAKITSDGLLGGEHIAIAPGGAADNLKAGDDISNTQGAVDLFGLIGKVLRPNSVGSGSGDSTTSGPSSATSTPSSSSASAANLPDVQ